MGRKKKKSIKASVPSLRQMLVRFWPLIRKQRAIIGGAMFALLAEVGLRLLEPWPLKFVLDRVVIVPTAAGTPGSPAGLSAPPVPSGGPLAGLDTLTLLALCAAAVVAIAGVRAVAGYLRRVGFALAGSRILTQTRGELFSHLQRLSLSYHSQRRSGDLIMRVTGDIGRLKEVAVTAIMPLVAHVITLVGMLAVMFWMQWRLAIVAVAIMPLFLLSTRRIGGKIRQVARKQRERKGEMGATAVEALGSIKTVQSLALEDIHEQTFTARNKSDLREGVRAKRLSARLIGTADVLIALGTGAVLWFGGRMMLRGEISPGDLIVFLAYLKSALRPVRNLAKYSGRIAKAAASAERIIEVLETTPQIRNRRGATDLPPRVEEVAFDNVTFGYEKGQIAVEGIEFTARSGDVIVLCGPSGAGKSTIVNLLLRLYDPDDGRIAVNGTDIRDCTIESLRRSVSVVPQENVLFAVSIRDNIAYGSPGATEEEIVAAARLAEAHDFIEKQPQGYDTEVGERGELLSEGQRQRVAIARAAIRGASILVLDEPTASLDNESDRLVRHALAAMSEDRISFIIAHDLSTVRPGNTVLFLDGGRVVERGEHEELLARGGRYAAMYALQRPDEHPDPASGTEAGRSHALGG